MKKLPRNPFMENIADTLETQQSKPQHTPTLWTIGEYDTEKSVNVYDQESGDLIAECRNNTNAAYIVKAVNCHQELLQELKDARDELVRIAYTGTHPAMDRINKAILKAEGR